MWEKYARNHSRLYFSYFFLPTRRSRCDRINQRRCRGVVLGWIPRLIRFSDPEADLSHCSGTIIDRVRPPIDARRLAAHKSRRYEENPYVRTYVRMLRAYIRVTCNYVRAPGPNLGSISLLSGLLRTRRTASYHLPANNGPIIPAGWHHADKTATTEPRYESFARAAIYDSDNRPLARSFARAAARG